MDVSSHRMPKEPWMWYRRPWADGSRWGSAEGLSCHDAACSAGWPGTSGRTGHPVAPTCRSVRKSHLRHLKVLCCSTIIVDHAAQDVFVVPTYSICLFSYVICCHSLCTVTFGILSIHLTSSVNGARSWASTIPSWDEPPVWVMIMLVVR